MMALRFRSRLPHAVAGALLALALPAPALAAAPNISAIVGARIVVQPGQVIERGTIVIRDGVITAVGANVPVPADARIWDGDSLTVYAGLIDMYQLAADVQAPGSETAGVPGARRRQPPPQAAPPARGATAALTSVHPELRVADSFVAAPESLAALRAAGFAVANFVPRRGILRGSSAVVGLADVPANRGVIDDHGAQVVSIETDPVGYPGSTMGTVALIRQSFMDARWCRDVQAMYAKSPSKPRPVTDLSLAALEPAASGRQPVMFLAGDMLEALRAATVAKEQALTPWIAGGGDEYKRAREFAAAGIPLVIPVRFPDPPDVLNPLDAIEVPIEELRAWNDAPANPAALAHAGVTFALTSNGLPDPRGFRDAVGKAIARGLDPRAALAAVTTVPAKILGLSDRLGTLAAGKAGDLTVTRGDLFAPGSKVVAVWVDGVRQTVRSDSGTTGNWELAWGTRRARLVIATDKDTTVRLVVGTDTLKASAVRFEPGRVRFQAATGTQAAVFDLRPDDQRLVGTVDGARAVGVKVTGAGPKPATVVTTPAVMGNTEPWRMSAPARPGMVLVQHATVWTEGPQGTLEDADLLVRDGKIEKVGKDLKAPAGAVVIDGRGKHVAPGIIDCHSHSAIFGGVNECTNIVTAEVRIADVVNSESIQIYRQLASGGTIMHLLHGSCNAIGGQCAVIKNRWGESPDRLIYTPAPPTIKFALGENPKQSNWGVEATGRYPQSRAGVEQSIRDAFSQARDYGMAMDEWKKKKQPYPPRRDLQKEAVLEILQGRRFIHSHSYRQDEILMLMRLTQEFGIHVQTFQHVLEGYKVADEMAAHGAGGSTFSDWWAYKYEVIDAIPYNGFLMWDRGVTVSYNSDSDDLARRLNTEAAKAIKYGGVPPEEALKFVTLNPAKQLRIDDRVGSLEPGKDADFSIWNGSPLSAFSRCEQTWIEGRKYFDRDADLAGREALGKERDSLVAAARAAKGGGAGGGGRWRTPAYLEDSDRSGNSCGDEAEEAASRALHSRDGEDRP